MKRWVPFLTILIAFPSLQQAFFSISVNLEVQIAAKLSWWAVAVVVVPAVIADGIVLVGVIVSLSPDLGGHNTYTKILYEWYSKDCGIKRERRCERRRCPVKVPFFGLNAQWAQYLNVEKIHIMNWDRVSFHKMNYSYMHAKVRARSAQRLREHRRITRQSFNHEENLASDWIRIDLHILRIDQDKQLTDFAPT